MEKVRDQNHAVDSAHHVIEGLRWSWKTRRTLAAFESGVLDALYAVVRGQGPQANGMPELHKLTPFLGVLQIEAIRWLWSPTCRALRQVPAAHLSPKAWPVATSGNPKR